MGREIKHVPLDFDWPLNVPWKGFINPYRSQKCGTCDGKGYNKETQKISDDWYDFDRTGAKWSDKITQDEVNALIKEGRLYDFTHTWSKDNGWVATKPQPIVTPEMVNIWSRNGMGHDGCNHSICVETRAKRLGVFGYCEFCNGEGKIWFSEKIKQLSDSWYDKEKYEPPAGQGWQIWETVSERSPISPVFETKDDIVEYLIDHGYSKDTATEFCESEWCMSMSITNGKIYSGIDTCGKLKEETSHES